MNNFTVTLCIVDRLCCNGKSNTLQKEITVTDLNQTIELQKNYTLHIINVESSHCTAIIQDGINTYILNIYTTFKGEICLCSTHNSSHKLSITCTIKES